MVYPHFLYTSVYEFYQHNNGGRMDIVEGIIQLPDNHMQKQLLVAGIYPWSKGLGYALFQGAEFLLDYGHPSIPPKNTRRYINRVKSFLERWEPDVIALRVETGKRATKSKIMNRILIEIRKIAQDMDIQVVEFSRKEISETFEPLDAFNRQMIAEKICEWFPILEELLPPKYTVGNSQHHRMPLFDAIALICTHYHFSS